MPAPGQEDPERWERYLETVHRGQIRELIKGYRPDLVWFDGAWERDERQWRMKELREEILRLNPRTVLNGRMLGHGDYATAELGVPIQRPDGQWELCYTIGDMWGYQPQAVNHKSVRELVRVFTETIGHGGNLLLNTGPPEDGRIRADHARRLEGLGRWIRRNSEAVYPTEAGLPYGHHYGPSMLSKDRRTLFLVCFDAPRAFVELRACATPSRTSPCSAPASALTTGSSAASPVAVCRAWSASTHPPPVTPTPPCSPSNSTANSISTRSGRGLSRAWFPTGIPTYVSDPSAHGGRSRQMRLPEAVSDDSRWAR